MVVASKMILIFKKNRSEITPKQSQILFLIFYLPQISKKLNIFAVISNELFFNPNVLRKKKHVIGGE